MRPNIYQLLRQGFNRPEIQRRLNWSQDQLDGFLATYTGYYRPTKREFYLNDEFFEIVDTEVKAYWLGFLYADGNVSHINLCMALQRGDEDHLVRFLKDLDSEYHVNRHDSSYMYKGETKMRYVSSIAISSLKITQDLIKLGCTPRKTFNLAFPTSDQVPNHLLHHFIRGYFDGDGCIFWSKTKRGGLDKSLDFVSSDQFISSLKTSLEINAGMVKSHLQPHASTKGITYLRYKSYEEIGKMYQYLYRDATVFLARKKTKMEETLEKQRYEAKQTEIPIIRREHAGQEVTCYHLQDRFGYTNLKAAHVLRMMVRDGQASYAGGERPKRYLILT